MTNGNGLGCSTITFRMLDLHDALERIAKSGLHAIDLGAITRFCPHADPLSATDDDLARLADAIASAGLQVSSVNAWSLTHLNDAESVELPYLRAALRLTKAVGAPVMTMQPGRGVGDDRWAEDARAVAEQIDGLGAEARELGLTLAVEAPHKGTLAERFDRACEFVELVDEDLVGVALDTSHVLNAGATIEDALQRYGSRIRHVHLRDYREGSILLTPGDGEIDFGGVFDGLEHLGYEGAYAFELEGRDATANEMERELHRAIEHVARLEQAGKGATR